MPVRSPSSRSLPFVRSRAESAGAIKQNCASLIPVKALPSATDQIRFQGTDRLQAKFTVLPTWSGQSRDGRSLFLRTVSSCFHEIQMGRWIVRRTRRRGFQRLQCRTMLSATVSGDLRTSLAGIRTTSIPCPRSHASRCASRSGRSPMSCAMPSISKATFALAQ